MATMLVPMLQQREEVPLWPEDTAGEQAARTLFRRLDRDGSGYAHQEEVLGLWPVLSQHLDAAHGEALGAQLEHRAEAIGAEEWMSLMEALREIVGSRRFRSSVRRAEATLAERRAQTSQPPKRTHVPYVAVAVPGAVETSPKAAYPAGTVLFPAAGSAGPRLVKPLLLSRPAAPAPPTVPTVAAAVAAPAAEEPSAKTAAPTLPLAEDQPPPHVPVSSAASADVASDSEAAKAAPPAESAPAAQGPSNAEQRAVAEAPGFEAAPAEAPPGLPSAGAAVVEAIPEDAKAMAPLVQETSAPEPRAKSPEGTPRSQDDPEWLEAACVVDEVSMRLAELGNAMVLAKHKDEKRALLAQKRELEGRKDYLAALCFLEEPSRPHTLPGDSIATQVPAEVLSSEPKACPLPAIDKGSLRELRHEAAARLVAVSESGALDRACALMKAEREAAAAPSEAALPAKVCGVSDLRAEAAQVLMLAMADGKLEAALAKLVKPDNAAASHGEVAEDAVVLDAEVLDAEDCCDPLRDRARESLMLAVKSGALEAAVQNARSGPAQSDDNVEGMREAAFTSLMSALADGSLEAYSCSWQVAVQEAKALPPREAETEDVSALRDLCASALLQASQDGSLEAAVQNSRSGPGQSDDNFEGMRDAAFTSLMSALADGSLEDLLGSKLAEKPASENADEEDEDLRMEAATSLLNSLADGRLEAILRQERDDEDEECFRMEAAASLLSSLEDGRLEAILSQKSGDDQDDDVECLRLAAAASLLTSLADGSLEAILSKKKGGNQDDDVEGFRMEVAASLLAPLDGGSLEAVLSQKEHKEATPSESSNESEENAEGEIQRMETSRSLFKSLIDGTLEGALQEVAEDRIMTYERSRTRTSTEMCETFSADDAETELLREELMISFAKAVAQSQQQDKEEAAEPEAIAAASSENLSLPPLPPPSVSPSGVRSEAGSDEPEEGRLVVYAGRIVYEQGSSKENSPTKGMLEPKAAPPADEEAAEEERVEQERPQSPDPANFEGRHSRKSVVLLQPDAASQVPSLVLWMPDCFQESPESTSNVLVQTWAPLKTVSEATEESLTEAVPEPSEAPPLPPTAEEGSGREAEEGQLAKAAPPQLPPVEGLSELVYPEASQKEVPPVDISQQNAAEAAEDDEVVRRKEKQRTMLADLLCATMLNSMDSSRPSSPEHQAIAPEDCTMALLPPQSRVNSTEPSPCGDDLGGAQLRERRGLVLSNVDACRTAPLSPTVIDEDAGEPPKYASESEFLFMESMAEQRSPLGDKLSRKRLGSVEKSDGSEDVSPPNYSSEASMSPGWKSRHSVSDGASLRYHLMQQQQHLRDEVQARQQMEAAQEKEEQLRNQLEQQQAELLRERERFRQEQERVARERAWHDEQRLMLQQQVEQMLAEKAHLQETPKARKMVRAKTMADLSGEAMGVRSSLPAIDGGSGMSAVRSSRQSFSGGSLSSSAPPFGAPVNLPPLMTCARTLPPPNGRRLSQLRAESPPPSEVGSRRGSKRPPEERVELLQRELQEEKECHAATAEQLKDVARQLRIAAAKIRKPSPPPRPPKKFGVSSAAPYSREQPLPPEIPKPKHAKAMVLPALRQLPPAPPKEDRRIAEAEAAEARQACISQSRLGLSRKSKSASRLDAISKLDSQGMNTWKVRSAEKVARLQDMQSFGVSMWGSFFEWQDDSVAVD